MWLNPITQTVLRTHSEIRAACSQQSLPAVLTDDIITDVLGLRPITPTPPPAHDAISQVLTELPPVEVDGELAQAWAVTDLPPQQALANLTAARLAKRDQINAWQLAASRRTFDHNGVAVDCDELGRSYIDGVSSYVSLTGQLPPAFPGWWKAADNSLIPIPDVAAWHALVGSMVAAGAANFAHTQALKAALEQANTQAELDAIQW